MILFCNIHVKHPEHRKSKLATCTKPREKKKLRGWRGRCEPTVGVRSPSPLTTLAAGSGGGWRSSPPTSCAAALDLLHPPLCAAGLPGGLAPSLYAEVPVVADGCLLAGSLSECSRSSPTRSPERRQPRGRLLSPHFLPLPRAHQSRC